MTSSDILQILREHDGSIERSHLIKHLRGFSNGHINRKLEELTREGSIKISGNTAILIPAYRANQMLRHGNVNEDCSEEPTGHIQISIPYDNTLFRVLDESDALLAEITVDEGMVDLLKAIWRHGISTNHSCQGIEGEEAWIRFVWYRDVDRFNRLVGHLSRHSGENKWTFHKSGLEISFPPKDIARITEELNNQAVT
ncbi:MAG: hypothetical protein PHE51_12715 [Eubacteriales bacterium]|nr:hypothetical protein [Eubacteriales bacterium]